MGTQKSAMGTQERDSLLDVILAGRGNSTEVMNRVIYVAHVSKECNDIGALEGYHRPIMVDCFGSTEKVFGVLIHMGNDTVLHMVEAPAAGVNALLQKLAEDKNSPLSNIRVIVYTEDIQRPAMPLWFCKSINLPRPDSDLDKKDPIAPHVFRTYNGLVQIGGILTELQGEERAQAIEELKTRYHEKLPGNELIESMMKSNQCCHLNSFNHIFTEEVQILEESERIWPMMPSLEY